MYEILKVLAEKRRTPTREMTLILARCCHCNAEQVLALQHAQRANKEKRRHCPACIEDTFHGMTDTRFWRIWKGMKSRATNPEDKDYPKYGGAGRGLSKDWQSFEGFYRDMFRLYADGLTLERIDNTAGYSKQNCRWAPNMEQQANKRSNRRVWFQGRDMHLAEFCRLTGVGRCAVTTRLNRGMSAEEALRDYWASPYPKHRQPRTFTT
jgi:hypothetical protein